MQTEYETDEHDFHPVKEEIERAFNDTLYPGDGAIIVEPGRDYDADKAFDDLRGKSWQQLSTSMGSMPFPGLCPYRDAAYYVTEQAFAYYLPAYMIRSLDWRDDQADELRDSLLQNLSDSSDYTATRMKGVARRLTPDQRAAVLSFLRFIKNVTDPLYDNYPNLIEFWTELL